MSDQIQPLTADERAAFRRNHHVVEGRRGSQPYRACPCLADWPCPTIRMLDLLEAVEQRATDAEAAPACGQTYADPRCEAMTRAMREAGDHALDGGCGKPLVWKLAYRCLECGRWMHQDCLRQHFEETRDGACPAERERDEALARVDALTAALDDIMGYIYEEYPTCDEVADRIRAALVAGPAPGGEPAP